MEGVRPGSFFYTDLTRDMPGRRRGFRSFRIRGGIALECRQITIFGEEIPQEAPEVLRDRDGRFLPGSSGNPSGRQKATWEEREALEEIKKLAPGVAGRMTALLDDENTPANVKVRIMEIILERTYGKPEAAIKLKAEVRSGEASRARLEAIAARIRLEVDQDE